LTPNQKAFLDMLAWSEGTAGHGDDGYNVLVGGDLFHSYADHPHRKVEVQPGLWSTAAGRYQILGWVFNSYKALLGLPDFGPDSQDKIALQLIKECRACDDIENGRLDAAIAKCAHIWASLPGAGYHQPERQLTALRGAYEAAGGILA
jgi:muramidase (phage lysozyme)